MSRRFFLLFLAIGIIGSLLGWFIDNERGLAGVMAAWLICLVPIGWLSFRHWVAKNSGNSKMIAKQGLPVSAREILTRLAWVLGASFVLYWHFGPRLGIGFWLAVLVFYQIMLAMQTIDRLHEPPR